MNQQLDGHGVHLHTGGMDWDGRTDPVVVLVHGAGMDSTVWYLQTRYLAHRGLRVAAIDLPGHGLSGGEPLASIEALADWLGRLVETWGGAHIVGHSMGTFVGLELAARRGDLVHSLTLFGTAPAMPVHPELLAAASDDLPKAAALMADWGHGRPAHTGRHPAPGLAMTDGARALVERSRPGVLATDFGACMSYDGALGAAAKVRCPTSVVAGALDKMTPAKGGQQVAAALDGASFTRLEGIGHQMMTEAPADVRRLVLEQVRSVSLAASSAG